MRYPSSFLHSATGAVGTLALCAALHVTAAPLANDDGKVARANTGDSVKNGPALDAPPAANLAPPAATNAAVQRNIAPSTAIASTGTTAAPAPDSIAKDASGTSTRAKPKLVVRGRLDDGRYLGFHQQAEDFRTSAPVRGETDRLISSRQAPAK